MKQSLSFQSEQEFQNFCSQLLSAEFDNFQAIEGAGGDGGLDGMIGDTAIQVYYPDKTNRTTKKYKEKIDADIPKLIKTSKQFGAAFNKWIFVVPDDLRYEVVLHLVKKSTETGIQCVHWGASKLTELVNKHPHVKNTFPGIFLPDLQQEMSGLEGSITRYLRPRNQFNVEIITDDDFKAIDEGITQKYHVQSRGAQNRFGGSSATFAVDEIYRQEANRSHAELRRKKAASDRAFQLEIEELDDVYIEAVRKVRESMNMRGIPGSGIEKKELDSLEAWKKREVEKLNLKYGKQAESV